MISCTGRQESPLSCFLSPFNENRGGEKKRTNQTKNIYLYIHISLLSSLSLLLFFLKKKQSEEWTHPAPHSMSLHFTLLFKKQIQGNHPHQQRRLPGPSAKAAEGGGRQGCTLSHSRPLIFSGQTFAFNDFNDPSPLFFSFFLSVQTFFSLSLSFLPSFAIPFRSSFRPL